MKMMKKELLAILVCPICKGALLYDSQKDELLCHFDRIAYPVRNGVPIMLVDEARKLEEEDN